MPIDDGGRGTVAFGLLGGIGLDLMLAGLAPYNEAKAGPSGTAERHRRARLGFHRRLLAKARGRSVRVFGMPSPRSRRSR